MPGSANTPHPQALPISSATQAADTISGTGTSNDGDVVPEIVVDDPTTGRPAQLALDASVQAADTALGTPADVAWSGSGSGSVEAINKAIWTRLRGGQATMANGLPVVIASDQSALSIRQLTASDVVTVNSSSGSPVIAQIQDLLRSKNKVSVSADTAFVATPTTALPNAAATSVPFGVNTSAANYPKSQQILIQAVGTSAGTAVPTNVYFSFGTANASSFPIPGGTAGPLILTIEATSISIYNNSGGALQCNPAGGTAGIRLEVL